MARNQETIARIEYTVNEALTPITQVAKLRDRESSRRWQAHYDLIRGRLLAMKIRCAEYQTACARMKKDAPKFKDAKSNAWRLVPAEEILSGDKVAKVARETQALLQRVVDDHPNTPWALLAETRAEGPLRLPVGRDLRQAAPPPQGGRRGRGQEEERDEEGHAQGARDQALTGAPTVAPPSGAGQGVPLG